MIRVSTLESFRKFLMDEDQDVFNPNIPETESMRAGTAFHKALETAQAGEYETVEANGYRFVFDFPVSIFLPEIREVRGFKRYGDLVVTGQVDCLAGKRVEDHKTTAIPNLERFMEGYQWRYYLDMFEADTFRWNIFTIEQDETDPKLYTVKDFNRLEMNRYLGLHTDCMSLAQEYLNYERKAA